MKALLPSVRSIRSLAMMERMSASPGMARTALEAVFRIDVRSILPTITMPTLVIHARDEVIPVQEGRYIADHIPGARLLEVDGNDHVPWLADPDRILTVIEEFLTGTQGAPSQSRRALRTVLFTDMVASTQQAAAMGDERWRAVLHRFGEITAELTQRFGGTVVESTGDGHLITFDGPTQAIRCAEALRADAETLGTEIRAGIHTGECELLDDSIGGIAVHIGGRSPLPAGGICRGGTGINADPRASHRDAPLGPRRGRDGQAHAVDPAQDSPPRPGHRPQMNRDTLSRNAV